MRQKDGCIFIATAVELLPNCIGLLFIVLLLLLEFANLVKVAI